MRTASAVIDDAGRARINEAVRRAETLVAAEIVPVVATDSGRYDRAEDLIGLLAGLLACSAAWFAFQGIDREAAWGQGELQLPLWALLAILVLGCFAGSFAAARIAPLRRLFVTARQRSEEVEAAAEEAFFDARVHHTESRCGLLLYVSLFERRAAVLGDAGVLDAVGMPALEQVCAELTRGLRETSPDAALVRAIEAAVERLQESLPQTGTPRQELPDALVLLD